MAGLATSQRVGEAARPGIRKGRPGTRATFPLTFFCSMRHIIRVTALRFQLKPGEAIVDQVVFAAKKAFISGEFQPGQTFPLVRVLASALKIYPNTAHKAIQHLVQERWLEVHQGVGTVVAKRPEPRRGTKSGCSRSKWNSSSSKPYVWRSTCRACTTPSKTSGQSCKSPRRF